MTANSIHWTWPLTDQNITFLPISDPLCANDTCLEYATAHKESQARISWASQFEYGKYVSYFYCAIIGIATIAFAASSYSHRRTAQNSRRFQDGTTSASEKLRACFRRFSYRRFSGAGNTFLPCSLGLAMLILVSLLFSVLLCFVQHPYYRADRGYGSPALGVRAGLAAIAMTPITVALSGKYNFITLLTGVSYEKLHVLHRWAGYIYLFFSIVHTIPFIIADLASGGSTRLWYQFYNMGSMEYTGIAPLAVLVFLCVPYLIPGVKSKMYELFVHTHILGWLAFFATTFWHAADKLDSWIYMYFTAAIYVIQLFMRWLVPMAAMEPNRNGRADVELLDDGSGEALMLQVNIRAAMTWTPGQHCFLRFPTLGFFDNHPFTIASLAESPDYASIPNTATFLIRPYNGLTDRLLQHARRSGDVIETQRPSPSSMGVFIDGPYGGINSSRSLHQRYDQAVLVCGGGGISAMLPWILHFAKLLEATEEACRLNRLTLVWCIQHASAQAWVADALEHAAAAGFEIIIHVTQENGAYSPESSSANDEDAKCLRPANRGNRRKVSYGKRPDIRPLLEATVDGSRSLVMACGPDGLKIDVANAVAAMQRRVWRGEAHDLTLHTESFGW